MESTIFNNIDVRRTRFRDENEKRKAKELLKEKAELKRKKEMFAPRKFIGLHDILVNSKLPKIKLEEDVGCSSSSVKPERMEIEPSSNDRIIDNKEPALPSDDIVDSDMDIEENVLVSVLDKNESNILPESSENSRKSRSNICKNGNEAISKGTDAFSEYFENDPITLLEIDEDESEVLSQMSENENKSLSEINENGSKIEETHSSFKTEDSQFLQQHIDSLKVIMEQKDQEIKLLIKLIKNLEGRVAKLKNHTVNEEQEKQHNNNEHISKNNGTRLSRQTTKTDVAMQRMSDLRAKNIKIEKLTEEMAKLQNEIFIKMNTGPQIITHIQPSENLMVKLFQKILPFLYPDLQLSHIMTCRNVCRGWRIAIDNYLNNNPVMLPFNKEIHLKEFQQLEFGSFPRWNEPLFTELATIYTFTDLRALDIFTDDKYAIIVGSSVCLDNIIMDDPLGVFSINKLFKFLKTHGSQIKYFKIRQYIESNNFNIKLFVERIVKCLWLLLKLKRLTLSFYIDDMKFSSQFEWNTSEKNVTHGFWEMPKFPKLPNLESLVFQIEESSINTSLLRDFCTSFIRPYCSQLKQFSIFTYSIAISEGFRIANLKELSIPQIYLDGNQNLENYENIEKVLLTGCDSVLKNEQIEQIKNLFPNVTWLGFKFNHTIKFRDNGKYIFDLPNLQVLELENCGGVTLKVLRCFPNLRYLKLIYNRSNKVWNFGKAYAYIYVLNVMKLSQGENLYEFNLFWGHVPAIRVVTLELRGEPLQNVKPKLFTWSRKGYIQYKKDKMYRMLRPSIK